MSDRLGVAFGPFMDQIEVEQNTRTGSTTTRQFHGTYEEVENQRLNEINQGASQVILNNRGDGFWNLKTYYPYDQFGFETIAPSIHELEVNIAQESIWQSPQVWKKFNGLEVSVIQQIVRDYQSGKYPDDRDGTALEQAQIDVYDKVSDIPSSDAVAQLAVALLNTIVGLGTEAFTTYSSVYRRTLTAATPFQVRASQEGVGKIWTTAEIIAFEQIPQNGFLVLDPDMQWLKAKPQVLACANQKTQVVYSFSECKLASAFCYEAWQNARLVTDPYSP